MVFLPVKPLEPFEQSMRERANGSNIVDQSFTMFYFMTWNRNISFQTWNISLLWIFNFSYRTYLVENLLFNALHKEFKKSTKSFSTKCVVYEKISINKNEIFHVRFAILQKKTEETCKNVL